MTKHDLLVSALVKSDKRLSVKNPNAYRMGIYLNGLQEMEDSRLCCLAHGLYGFFNDRLLSALERAVGLPVTYGGGGFAVAPVACSNGTKGEA